MYLSAWRVKFYTGLPTIYTAVQNEKAVTAYFSRKQFLSFDLAQVGYCAVLGTCFRRTGPVSLSCGLDDHEPVFEQHCVGTTLFLCYWWCSLIGWICIYCSDACRGMVVFSSASSERADRHEHDTHAKDS